MGVVGSVLGWGPVPLVVPLVYPGRLVDRGVVLDGERVRGWAGDVGRVVEGCGGAPLRERVPVLGVGSNGAPAQLAYKFARGGVSGVVPMVPVRVAGLGVGVSGHIGGAGYVPAAPYPLPGGASSMVLSWLDTRQLAVVDASERHNYERVLLDPGVFPVSEGTEAFPAPSGGVHVYATVRGVLARPPYVGQPRVAGPQPALLRELLRGSGALRDLLGADPASWVRRAAAREEVRERARALFREEGWVLDGAGPDAYRVDARGPEGQGSPVDRAREG